MNQQSEIVTKKTKRRLKSRCEDFMPLIEALFWSSWILLRYYRYLHVWANLSLVPLNLRRSLGTAVNNKLAKNRNKLAH